MLQAWNIDVEHVLHAIRGLDVLDFEAVKERCQDLIFPPLIFRHALKRLRRRHMRVVIHHLQERLFNPHLQSLVEAKTSAKGITLYFWNIPRIVFPAYDP